jgi:hypothetical protein
MNKYIHDLLMNIFGGFLVAVIDRLIIYFQKYFKGLGFKKIFGGEINDYYIVYGKMILNPIYSSKDPFPYLKPKSSAIFNMTNPVSFSETRASKYLSISFFNNLKSSPKLISDDELSEKLDVSYCSLGGYNNSKTIEILNGEENKFYTFQLDKITSKIVKNKNYIIDSEYDYAVIIKIRNKHFPNRVQICVAGLGEWGTSGASWFLANKWKELKKRAKGKSFGAIIRVRFHIDESAELVDILT